MSRINLNEKTLKGIKPTEKPTFYSDENLPGFGVLAQGNSMSYVVRGRVNGRQINVSLGKVEKFSSVKDAREQARQTYQELKHGVNPIEKARQERSKSVTLQTVFNDYLSDNKSLKPRTIGFYNDCFRLSFSDWANKPLRDITDVMVKARHKKITTDRGASPADGSMKMLRAIWNYAKEEYEGALPEKNPCTKLSKTKAWNKPRPRESFLRQDDLPVWFNSLNQLTGTGRDALLLLLFTGLRKNEALTLKWENVDFTAKTLTFPDTKNRKTFVLPMSSMVEEIMLNRRQFVENEFVFPGRGEAGHFIELRKQIGIVKEQTGIDCMPHDLRRTFITNASCVSIGLYQLKALVNHSTEGDVTAGYNQITAESLREPAQKVCDHIMLTCQAWSPWPRVTCESKSYAKTDKQEKP